MALAEGPAKSLRKLLAFVPAQDESGTVTAEHSQALECRGDRRSLVALPQLKKGMRNDKSQPIDLGPAP